MSFDLGPALLFCPADRPDRYQKAADRADAVIIDLEDAIMPANRARSKPEQTRDDTDAGWGERPDEGAHDQWLQEQRPPHWG